MPFFHHRSGKTLEHEPGNRRHIPELSSHQLRGIESSTQIVHQMSMGAIVSATMVSVQLKGQGLLGHVEESFVASLREGDAFVFAGQTVALVSFQGLVAKVRRSKSSTARTPAWMGGRMSLSSELSHRLRWAWDRMAGDEQDWEPELQRLSPMVQIQAERSHIPRADELLVETYHDEDGHHLFLYPFEGRKVHEALAMLLAYRLSLMAPQTFNWACNDDGLELLSDQPIVWEQIVDTNLLDPAHLMDDLSAGFNASELVRRKFRDVATVAGLVFQGFPGAVVKERHLLTRPTCSFKSFRTTTQTICCCGKRRMKCLQNNWSLVVCCSGCSPCLRETWCIARWTNRHPWPFHCLSIDFEKGSHLKHLKAA